MCLHVFAKVGILGSDGHTHGILYCSPKTGGSWIFFLIDPLPIHHSRQLGQTNVDDREFPCVTLVFFTSAQEAPFAIHIVRPIVTVVSE